MKTVRKAYAYITRGQQLLVFSHPDHPGAGIQVPKGTIGPDEQPEKAVLREAEEETGLCNLKIVRFLGDVTFDMMPYGENIIYHRFFYHLECMESPPNSWYHYEEDPSDGLEKRIRFYLYWVNVPDGLPDLSVKYGYGQLLDELVISLGR